MEFGMVETTESFRAAAWRLPVSGIAGKCGCGADKTLIFTGGVFMKLSWILFLLGILLTVWAVVRSYRLQPHRDKRYWSKAIMKDDVAVPRKAPLEGGAKVKWTIDERKPDKKHPGGS